MSKAPMFFKEIKHSDYIIQEYNDFDELVETTLPENVVVYSAITPQELKEGLRNQYAIQM